jgi:predicted HTH transcriptional regulator
MNLFFPVMKKEQERVSFNLQELRDLKKLVARGEGQKLEFKRKASFPEKIVREMIAFANASGGVLLIGVDDDGNIPGLKYPEDDSHVVTQALKFCKPGLAVKEEWIPIGNSRSVIYYHISESKRKPHYLFTDGSKNSFVRVADQSIKASHEVKEIVRRAQRKRDIKFHFGDHEKILMQYLDKNPTITVKEFMQLGKLKRFYASRKLILLVLANVLRITPHEKEDLFSLQPVQA